MWCNPKALLGLLVAAALLACRPADAAVNVTYGGNNYGGLGVGLHPWRDGDAPPRGAQHGDATPGWRPGSSHQTSRRHPSRVAALRHAGVATSMGSPSTLNVSMAASFWYPDPVAAQVSAAGRRSGVPAMLLLCAAGPRSTGKGHPRRKSFAGRRPCNGVLRDAPPPVKRGHAWLASGAHQLRAPTPLTPGRVHPGRREPGPSQRR